MDATQAVLFQIFYSSLVIIALFAKPPFCNVSTPVYRCSAMVVMTILSFALIFYFDLDDKFYWFNNPYLSKCAILSTITLFLGPIVQNIFTFFNEDYPYIYRKSMMNFFRHLKTEFLDFESFKALIIGPFSEEMIYRSFSCTLWEKSHISNAKIIFSLSFIFGVSHLNKLFLEKNLRTITMNDLIPRFFEIGYTTVFGFWEGFIWLKTHSYLTCVFIHAFCNYMQFPQFGAALNWSYPIQKIFLYLVYLIGVICFGCSIGLIQTTK